jgi:hypothetical protein
MPRRTRKMKEVRTQSASEDLPDAIVRAAYRKFARDADTRRAIELWDQEQSEIDRGDTSP